ncbi:hypothetical protein [Homoserinimonas hongtaonis]|nr:hypothetical protein [Salinibacterium hongtaonis]
MPLPISEALANLRASLGFGLILFFVSLLAGGGIAAASTLEAGSYAHKWHQQVQTGRFVFTIASATSATLDASRCDALNSISGVSAAGAITSERDIEFPQTGNQTWRESTVTPRFPAAAWNDGPPPFSGSNAIFPNELADLLSAVPGSRFTVVDKATGAESSTRVEWTSEHRSRIDGINRNVIRLGEPSGATKICYVSTEPAAFLDVGSAARGWFGEPVQVSELGQQTDGAGLSIAPARLMDWGWVAVAAAVLLLASSWWFARRADLALYRLLGMATADFLRMMTTECALLVLAPTALGAAFALLVLRPTDAYVIASVGLDLLRYMVILCSLPLIALLLGRRSNTVRTLSGY